MRGSRGKRGRHTGPRRREVRREGEGGRSVGEGGGRREEGKEEEEEGNGGEIKTER